MLKALNYLHEVVKLVHRDIKPNNIMIRRSHEATLVDFGIEAIMEGSNLRIDTLMYFAPELLRQKKKNRAPFSAQTDIWALGATFFYLLTGKYPFGSQKSLTKLAEAIKHTTINFKVITNEKARACIKRMLDKNPETRITIEDLLKMDWVTNSGTEPIVYLPGN